MLSCRELANGVASDHLDGTLGARARLAVRVHLSLCANCRRFVAQLQRVRAVLAQRGTARASSPGDTELSELAERLHALARRETDSS